MAAPTYQDMLASLQAYWAERGCVIMQPYHTEVAAGTMNPATFLRCLGQHEWRTAYVEPVIRPTDGRYGENPFRFQHYYQLQVILKPTPDDVLDHYWGSLEALGIDLTRHDPRLVEDDWEQPTLGAWGLGWEVWLDGMEITQFTYFQQLGGMDVDLVPAEITYGTERLAMFLQGRDSALELEWAPGITWGDVYREAERQFSTYNFEAASVDMLMRHFDDYEGECGRLLERGLPLPAYDQVLKCSHTFNLLDARGAVSVTERAAYIGRVRNLARNVARAYVESLDAHEVRDSWDAAGRASPEGTVLGTAPERIVRSGASAGGGAGLGPAGADGGQGSRTLLFEIGSEELPASAVVAGARQLPELVRAQLGVEPAHVYAGPRRLAVRVEGLAERTPDEWAKGPPVALRERAAAGFSKRHGVSVDDLEERDGFLGVTVPGKALAEVLPERLGAILRALAFPKTMRWDASGLRYPRPVRWMLARLDDAAVEGFGTTTFGHRFSAGDLDVPRADDYERLLREANVEPDAVERERAVRAGLDALGEWSDPLGKLAEVVHLVEWPRVQEGTFAERYLGLPERVVVTAMQSHQRYFPLGGNRFAFVANGGEPETVREGNERVLTGRLEDATFTFERDVARGIDELVRELASITFFAGAGSFADKTERLVQLVDELGGGEAPREGARLAKADQAAELVREFPDLEGYIGAEYARLAGYPEAVAKAVEEQYLPDSASGALPETDAGKILAAAEKIDNLRVAFGLGHKPTGSRDPYGLRRAAIGLLRLATEGALPIDRTTAFPDPELRDFVEERLEALLDVPVEFVRAARKSGVRDLGAVAALARFLAALGDDRLEPVHTVFTRASRIAGSQGNGSVNPSLLTEDAEVQLARAVESEEARIAREVEEGDFESAFDAAATLAPVVERFFDEVLVMAEDAAIRTNRLRLLSELRDAVGALGDFSEIPRLQPRHAP